MNPNDDVKNTSFAERFADGFENRGVALGLLPQRSLDICFIAALVLTVFYFLQWPIVAFDTDLWTHLNGGRYLVEHGKLPETSFYSFVRPQREIVSYSWLFKAFVYQVFRFSGYHGLIVFRTLVCTATLTLVFLILRNSRAGIGSAAVFVLVFLLFVDSGEGIRPYNLSYFFVAVFLYVLEHHPRKAFLLPAVAVVWINVHGIEYPVMILIVSGYLAAYFLHRHRQGRLKERPDYRTLIPLVLCLAAVFGSPYGAKLLPVPFTDIAYASKYIAELRKFVFDDLLHFRFSGLAPDFSTVSNLLIFTILTVVLLRLGRRQIPLHHLVLFAGGCLLLTKGARFIHEFALLSLPCLAAVDRQSPEEPTRPVRPPASAAITVVLVAVSFLYMHNLYAGRPKYPVTKADLPTGVAAFLQHVGAKGRILNDPATGGYLSWRMWPDCLIYMDMQVPFLFTDNDFFEGVNAIYDKEACRRLLRRYQPDYLSLPIHSPLNADSMIRSAGYVPVFFDDREILYVFRERHPTVADAHELKRINPAANGRIDFQRLAAESEQSFLAEAQRLAGIYPQGLMINRLLSLYYADRKDFPRAVVHAERIIRSFPNHAEGYLLKAVGLKEMREYTKALTFYRRALTRTEEQQRKNLYRAMAQCHFALKQYRKAYAILRNSENFFSPAIGHLDLYRLALAAYQAGKADEARMLAKFAAFKQPDGKGGQDPRIGQLIRILENTPQ